MIRACSGWVLVFFFVRQIRYIFVQKKCFENRCHMCSSFARTRPYGSGLTVNFDTISVPAQPGPDRACRQPETTLRGAIPLRTGFSMSIDLAGPQAVVNDPG